MKVHLLKIEFHVTKEIKRYVYVYLLEGKDCYLIDAGVFGCEKVILDKIREIGKKPENLKGIFLTHAHPDHIGAAAWLREHTGCKIYASAGEKRWIEDIDIQYKERPIPNFYNLAGKSVPIDYVVKDGDKICLEEEICIQVLGTCGHSADEVSYLAGEAAFIGDSIPVKGEIPIYIDKEASVDSIKKLYDLEGMKAFYPAWDQIYSKEELKIKALEGLGIINRIDAAVAKITNKDSNMTDDVLAEKVAQELDMPFLKQNPLFAKTAACHRKLF